VARANERAADAPLVAELRATGKTSLRAIAAALDDIGTPRGVGEWQAGTVARLLARCRADTGGQIPFGPWAASGRQQTVKMCGYTVGHFP
jgi:hypothetical protein